MRIACRYLLIIIICLTVSILTGLKIYGGTGMEIKSSAFKQGEFIPPKYTCDGADVSPPLEWNNAPAGTKSFALICDDPDAPRGSWVHWVIYNIPTGTSMLPENISKDKQPSTGGMQGTTDFKKIGYGGPCPPGGTHRYFFKLYALDCAINLSPGATKQQLLDSIKGHVLAESQLMGKYSR